MQALARAVAANCNYNASVCVCVCIGCSKWLPLRATDARSLIIKRASADRARTSLCAQDHGAADDCSASARTADFFGTAADAANNFFGYYMEEQRVCEEREM